jgi:hypothetical protein
MAIVEDTGEEGSCFHIGDISVTRTRGTLDSVHDDDEEATTQHLRNALDSNQNLEDNTTLGEESSCFHIGEIVTGRTINSNDDSVASLAAATAPSAANNSSNNKKKWIISGALVIATSLTITIGGAIIADLRSKQKFSVSGATSFDTENELPWWACLKKESCFDQAKVLGYADIRSGDYSYNQMYGCFKNEGIIYWGMGGTDAQNASSETKERLWCYDVNPNPLIGIDDNCDSAVVQPSISSPPSSSQSITTTTGLSK